VDAPPIAGDPRFFARTGPHSVAAVAAACGAAAPASERLLHGVAPLQSAGPEQVSFLDNRRYAAALAQTRAGAVIVHPDLVAKVPAGAIPLRAGVHPHAVVEAGAEIDPTAEIGPFAVIGAGARIGPGCRIGPGAVIGPGVQMGADCRVGASASLSHALLGARVYVYPGARIGQDGFGFAMTDRGFVTVPQLGRVILEDDVEVGANSTIDRGSAQDTVIGAGSRLDNLVQIGHNVRLGRCCVIVAQAGISGSTVLEDFVMVGGQGGLTGHLRIGRKARIGAQAGVMADVAAGTEVVGSPAMPVREFFRQVVALRRLAGERRKPAAEAGGPQAATEKGTERTGSD